MGQETSSFARLTVVDCSDGTVFYRDEPDSSILALHAVVGPLLKKTLRHEKITGAENLAPDGGPSVGPPCSFAEPFKFSEKLLDGGYVDLERRFVCIDHSLNKRRRCKPLA